MHYVYSENDVFEKKKKGGKGQMRIIPGGNCIRRLLLAVLVLMTVHGMSVFASEYDYSDTDSIFGIIGVSDTDKPAAETIPLTSDEGEKLLSDKQLMPETLMLLSGENNPEGDEGNGESESNQDESETQEESETEFDPSNVDGLRIKKAKLKWLTASTGESTPAGTGTLVFRNELPTMTWQLDFSTAGEGMIGTGDLEIILPAWVWLDRNGKEPSRIELAVPEEPSTVQELAWKRVGDWIIITNTRPISATGKCMVQGQFVNSGSPTRMKDGTKTEDYQHFFFTVNITTPANQALVTRTSNLIDAEFYSTVAISRMDKSAVSNNLHGPVYTDLERNPLPASLKQYINDNDILPEGTAIEDYYYVKWYVQASASGNQPYILNFKENTVQYMWGTGVEKQPVTSIPIARQSGSTYLPFDAGEDYELYRGSSFSNHGTYIWMAYPRSEFTEEGVVYTIQNVASATAEGLDNHVVTGPMSDSATATFRTPITWKIIKKWEYNEEKYTRTSTLAEIKSRRPTGLNVWYEDTGLTYRTHYYGNPQNAAEKRLTAADADPDYYRQLMEANPSLDPNYDPNNDAVNEDNYWYFEFTDYGKNTSYRSYEHSERVTNSTHSANGISTSMASGTIGERVYLLNGMSYQRHWWYDHRTNINPDTHTIVYVNDYHEGVAWTYPSSWGKSASRSGSSWWDQKSRNDRDLILLQKDLETTDINYSLSTSQYILERTAGINYYDPSYRYENDTERKSVKIELVDTYETFEGRRLTADDYYIRRVTMNNPSATVWVPSDSDNPVQLDQPEGKFESRTNYTYELYGLNDEGSWIRLAVYNNGNRTYTAENGATASGNTIILPVDQIRQVKAVMISDHAWASFGYSISVRLKPSSHIKAKIESLFSTTDFAMATHQNYAEVNMYQGDNLDELCWSKSLTAKSPLHGSITRVAAALRKSSSMTSRDKINKLFRYRNTITLDQMSNAYNLTEFLEGIEEGTLPLSQSGTFYDLLPPGMRIEEDSLEKYKNSNTNVTVDSCTIIDNYQNSGRQMIIFKVTLGTNNTTYVDKKYKEDSTFIYPPTYGRTATLSFDTIYTFADAENRGTTNLYNHAVYEADEPALGNWPGWSGENDTPGGPSYNHKLTPTSVQNNVKDLLTDLDPDHDNPSFVYAKSSMSANPGLKWYLVNLSKDVSVTGDGEFYKEGNVIEGGAYTYRLSLKNSEDVKSKEIILLDYFEEFYPDEDETADYDDNFDWRWKGALESVDVTEIAALGCAPKVYYTTLDIDLSAYNGAQGAAQRNVVAQILESGVDGWTTEAPADLSTVRAIAIDCREKAGGGEFELQPDQSVIAYVNMRAPYYDQAPDAFAEEGYDNADNNAHAINNTYVDMHIIPLPDPDIGDDEEPEEPEEPFHWYEEYHYTVVGIYSSNLDVVKVWDDQNDNDGKRPEEIYVYLYANGEITEREPLILNEENGWTGRFEYVRKYDAQGNTIAYTVRETLPDGSEIPGYTSSCQLQNQKFTITNHHDLEQTEFPFYKIWTADPRVEDGWQSNLPKNITVKLYADGKYTRQSLTIKVNSDGSEIGGVFTNLQKYLNKQEIVYSISENAVTDFITLYVDDDGTAMIPAYDEQGIPRVDEEGNPVMVPDPSGKQTDGDGINNVIKNIYYPFADLVVRKTGYNMPDYTEEERESDEVKGFDVFRFKLNLTEEADEIDEITGEPTGRRIDVAHHEQYEYMIVDAGVTIDTRSSDWQMQGYIANGMEFEMQAGQKLIVKDLPFYVKYSVSEESKDGWKLTRSSQTTSTIGSGGKTASFENTYSSTGSISIETKKNLTGRELIQNKFSFRLYDFTNRNMRSAVNKADGSITFGQLNFTWKDHGKQFVYRLEEYRGSDPGYTYDDTVFYIVLEPKDNGDGTMHIDEYYYGPQGDADPAQFSQEDVQRISRIQSVTGNNGLMLAPYEKSEAEFNNQYHASGEISLTAAKTLRTKYDRDLQDEEFSFWLFRVNENGEPLDVDETGEPAPIVIDRQKNDENGLVTFNPIDTFNETHVGQTFYYVAREIAGEDPTVVYNLDSFVYAVTVRDTGRGTLTFEIRTGRATESGTEDADTQDPDFGNTVWDLNLKEIQDPKNSSHTLLVPAATGAVNFVNELQDGSLKLTKWVSQDEEGNYEGDISKPFTFKITLPGANVPGSVIRNLRPEVEEMPEDPYQQPANINPTDYYVEFNGGTGASGSMVTRVQSSSYAFGLPYCYFRNGDMIFNGWSITGVINGRTQYFGIYAAGASFRPTRFPANRTFKATAQWRYRDAPESTTYSTTGNQVITVTLLPGESLTIPNIPAGTVYSIKEQTEHGWKVIEEVYPDGKIIAPITTSEAEFTNQYVTNEATIQFVGTKKLDELVVDVEQFSFGLYKYDSSAGYWVLLEGKDTPEDGRDWVHPDPVDGIVRFAPITYKASDSGRTYYYKIKEEETENNPAVYYDYHEELIEVYVGTENGVLYAEIKGVKVISGSSSSGGGGTEVGSSEQVPDSEGFVAPSEDQIGEFAFHNTTKPGSLSIEKLVEQGVDYKGDPDLLENYTFTFKVELKDKNGNPVTKLPEAPEDELVYKVNNEEVPLGDAIKYDESTHIFTVTLKAGDKALIKNLPAGWQYEVTETDLPRGWHLDPEKTTLMDGRIAAIQESEVQVTNYYTAEGTANLEAHKMLEGREVRKEEFSFTLYRMEGENEDILQDEVKNLEVDKYELSSVSGDDEDDDDDTAASPNPWYGWAPVYFDEPLTFTQEDIGNTYTYYIREEIPDIIVEGSDEDKIVYAQNVEMAEVYVYDQGNGFLGTTVTYYSVDENGNKGELKSGATFVNRLKPGNLEIKKNILDATENAQEKEFTFDVTFSQKEGTPLSGSYPYTIYTTSGADEEADESDMPDVPEGDDTDDDSGEPQTEVVSSGLITLPDDCDENGTVRLTIKGGQWIVVEGLPDSAAYTVEEESLAGWALEAVEHNGQALDPEETAAAEGSIAAGETAHVEYTNRYYTSGYAELTAKKKLFQNGEEIPLEDMKFTFALTDSIGRQIETARNEENGEIYYIVNFNRNDIGTHTYYIRELPGSEPDPFIKYDNRTCKVEIVVSDDGEGNLQTEVTYDMGVSAEEEPDPEALSEKNRTFVNERFDQLGAFSILKVDLEDNTPLVGAEFDLYRKNSEGAYVVAQETSITSSNGIITYEDLPAGEYMLRESKTPDGYIVQNKDFYFTLSLDRKEIITNLDKVNAGTEEPVTRAVTVSMIELQNSDSPMISVRQTSYWILEAGEPKEWKVNDDEVVIRNQKGTALPMTGGSGPGPYRKAGVLLMLLTLLTGYAICVLRKRREVQL